MISNLFIVLFILFNGRVFYPVTEMSQTRFDAIYTFQAPESTLLLTHSYLAGQYYYDLKDGDEITLIGVDTTRIYKVSKISRIIRKGYYFYEDEINQSDFYLSTCLTNDRGIGRSYGMLLIELRFYREYENGFK